MVWFGIGGWTSRPPIACVHLLAHFDRLVLRSESQDDLCPVLVSPLPRVPTM
jgi:hypothetical protein